MKGRFIINPFQELNLTPADRTSLEDLANQCITSNLQLCMKYMSGTTRRVDPQHWKPLKEKEKLKVYSERPEGVAAATASGNEPTGSGLPMILCVGTMEGKLEDLLYGVISEDLETMRMKASYVDDFSGAAVLDAVVLPTLEDPFQSLVIKWMELDIPFHSTSLVKNRDYSFVPIALYSSVLSGLHSSNSRPTKTTSCRPASSRFASFFQLAQALTDHSTAMVKGRFIVNPFTELALTENDHTQLKELANSLIMTNLEKYTKYQDEKNKGMDPRRWKLCKQRQGIKIVNTGSMISDY
ncbi:hypothetical protein PC117_g7913 [Phytophthora cactorum]|uniref:Uncharacterized protein n=1 Tax=Phytophthora cactorum TaxID=29920 RepID=A0A8T1E337_9STRA|nr:hypothetical protein PC117_g7913 [Phytophthora cactorum]